MMEQLTNKGTWDEIESAFNELNRRQRQIIKELEECTGIQITLGTKEDVLKENKRIQYGDDKDDTNEGEQQEKK
jgi:hypothetical protein